MLKRFVVAAVLCVLCACQQTKGSDPTLITGGGPVKVVESSFIATGESQPSLGSGSVTYIVSKIELTNNQSAAISPLVSHFSLTDAAGTKYFGVDTGSYVLTGISNDVSPIKPGEKRTFTVGFRAGSTTTGIVQYDY